MLAMDLCICFNQFLDEVSMMTIKVVINLIIGEVQFRYHLLYCLGYELGSSSWISGNYPNVRFLARTIIAPSIKTSFLALPLCSFPISVILFPQALLSWSHFTFPSFSPLPLTLFPPPCSQSSQKCLCISHSQADWCMPFFGFSLLTSSSGVVEYSLVILCFKSNIH